MINSDWTYFTEERFIGIVISLRPGKNYFYRAPDGQRFEVFYLAKRRSNVRIGVRPVDEEGKPIPKPQKGSTV